MHASFWTHLDALIRLSELVIDRPKGFSRPHAPALVYPLDYGYLQGTSSSDGEALMCGAVLFRKDT
jgi:inorganic pyrophosphatase